MAEIANDIRALRVVGGALILGSVLFLGVAVFLRSSGAFEERAEEAILTWVAAAVAGSAMAASVLLPRPPAGDIARIRGHFIVRLVLVESGALLATVAYLVEGELPAFGTAVACLGVMALVHFPTRDRVVGLHARSG